MKKEYTAILIALVTLKVAFLATISYGIFKLMYIVLLVAIFALVIWLILDEKEKQGKGE